MDFDDGEMSISNSTRVINPDPMHDAAEWNKQRFCRDAAWRVDVAAAEVNEEWVRVE